MVVAPEPAGKGMDRRAVGRAVVGHQPLDADAVAAVELDRPLEKRDRGAGLLVSEDLDVGQAGRVVDADVYELPALRGAAPACATVGVLAIAPAADAVPYAGDDPELFDVDVDQLARPGALIAIRR